MYTVSDISQQGLQWPLLQAHVGRTSCDEPRTDYANSGQVDFCHESNGIHYIVYIYICTVTCVYRQMCKVNGAQDVWLVPHRQGLAANVPLRRPCCFT